MHQSECCFIGGTAAQTLTLLHVRHRLRLSSQRPEIPCYGMHFVTLYGFCKAAQSPARYALPKAAWYAPAVTAWMPVQTCREWLEDSPGLFSLLFGAVGE
eukprot:GHRQ01035295.1.p3 GENE.GHRQ01035295.1~~GHRQ01035295.1.p3  ORF type:complete len:100 (-),score=6.38 GHRQ01035295.1:923-1222(-)